MSRAFFKPFYYLIIVIIIITMFVSIFFTPVINQNIRLTIDPNAIGEIYISEYGFAWPAPGYTTITSYFGKRESPTSGATSQHKGIDIGAPQGSYLVAVADGRITYTGFLGGGGYTITLTTEDDMKVTYCHVSPNYIVYEGDKVLRGDVIGQVGPKNVYGVAGNTYTDLDGNPTNGATTGPHLHLGIRIDDDYINPLNYYI